MKKFHPTLVNHLTTTASFSASSTSSTTPAQEKITQTEDTKDINNTNSQTTNSNATDTSTQSGLENTFDVDKLLIATYPNDANYNYKEKVTKDFVTKGEAMKKILGDTYKDNNHDGNDKTFNKSTVGDSLRYGLVPKNYDLSSKDTLSSYTYQLSIFDSLKTSNVTLEIAMKISASEQTAKLDDITQKILELYSTSINFDDVNKTIQECMTAAKNNNTSLFNSPNKINIDNSTTLLFSSLYSNYTQRVTIFMNLQQKGTYN